MKKKTIKIQTESETTVDEFTKAESIVISKLNDNIHTFSNNLPDNCYVRKCLECNVSINYKNPYNFNIYNCSGCGYYNPYGCYCRIAPMAFLIEDLYDSMVCGIVKEANSK